MRAAAFTSLTVHLTILALLFVVRTGSPLIVPGPEVIQVALLSPQAVAAPPPPVVKPEPEHHAPELKATDETGIKLAPPRPKPKAVKPKPEEKEPEPEPSAAALPYAPAGPAGLKGEVAVDTGDFEFTYYLILLRNRVSQNWSPPTGLVAGGQPVRAVIYFRVGRDGSVAGTRIESGSGVEFFDRSAVRAVVLSDPMPPLPLGYAGAELGVHFGFEYTAP